MNLAISETLLRTGLFGEKGELTEYEDAPVIPVEIKTRIRKRVKRQPRVSNSLQKPITQSRAALGNITNSINKCTRRSSRISARRVDDDIPKNSLKRSHEEKEASDSLECPPQNALNRTVPNLNLLEFLSSRIPSRLSLLWNEIPLHLVSLLPCHLLLKVIQIRTSGQSQSGRGLMGIEDHLRGPHKEPRGFNQCPELIESFMQLPGS